MFAVSADSAMRRRSGPKGKFASKEMQINLLLFLSDPSKTNVDAAEHFGCGLRTIEYALSNIRAAAKENAPRPDTSMGPTSTTPEGDVASILADADEPSRISA